MPATGDVAVGAWGSLIWQPPAYFHAAEPKRWRRDGPALPLECARINKNGLLVMCLVEDAATWAAVVPMPACWIVHAEQDVAAARQNLLQCERAVSLDHIGVWQRGQAPGPGAHGKVAAWATAKGLSGAVWAATPPRQPPFTADSAVEFLKGLHPTDQQLARLCVQKAPAQIQTPLRTRFREALDWQDEALPAHLFAD